jgi:hypothetical protein
MHSRIQDIPLLHHFYQMEKPRTLNTVNTKNGELQQWVLPTICPFASSKQTTDSIQWCGWTFDPRDDRGRPLPSKESHFDFRTDPTRYNFLKVDQFRAHLGLLLLRGVGYADMTEDGFIANKQKSLQASRTRDVVRSPDPDGHLMFEPGTSLADIPIDSYSMAGKDMLFSTVQDFVKQYGPARATWSINSLGMYPQVQKVLCILLIRGSYARHLCSAR